MTRYLLDTNIVSGLVRNPQGRAAARVAEVGAGAVCTSVIVAAALRYGGDTSGSTREFERVRGLSRLLKKDSPDEVTQVCAVEVTYLARLVFQRTSVSSFRSIVVYLREFFISLLGSRNGLLGRDTSEQTRLC